MNNITFEMVRKGYAVDEVDTYIQTVCKNYEKMEKDIHELNEKDSELKKYQKEKESTEDRIRIFKMKFENIEREKRQLQKQIQKLKDDNKLLTQQLDNKNQSKEDDQRKVSLEELKQKKESLLNQIREKEQVREETGKEENGPLEGFVLTAKSQAGEYVNELVKEEKKKNADEIAKAQCMIEEAKTRVKQWNAQAGEYRLPELDEQYEELVRQEEDMKKEREDFLDAYEYEKKEADVDLEMAKEKAQNIVRRERKKLEIAKDKNQKVTEQTYERIRLMGQELMDTYEQLIVDMKQKSQSVREHFGDN